MALRSNDTFFKVFSYLSLGKYYVRNQCNAYALTWSLFLRKKERFRNHKDLSLVIKAYMIQRIEFSPECQSLCGGWEVSCTLPVTLGATPAVSDLWGTDPQLSYTSIRVSGPVRLSNCIPLSGLHGTKDKLKLKLFQKWKYIIHREIQKLFNKTAFTGPKTILCLCLPP